MKKLLLLLFLFSLVFGSFACRTLKRTDDALRIKKDSAYKYTSYPYNRNIVRNGNTLRGMVLRFETLMTPDSCFAGRTPNYKVENRVAFLDVKSPNLRFVEYIPFEDVDFIGPKFGQPLNSVEDYNFPLEPKRFRYIPWDTIKAECKECNCRPFSLSVNLPCLFCPECPTRICKWYFLELRGGYSTYRDKITPNQTIWKDGFFGELTAGFRFGNRKQYAFGLMFSTGLPIYNSFTSEEIYRPLTLLHFRWDPFKNCVKPREKTTPIRVSKEPCLCPEDEVQEQKVEKLDLPFEKCINPYFFVQSGIPIDRFSIDLFKINISRADCKDKIQASAPYLDVKTVPVTFTIGVGVDYPISSHIDISVDAGWRSYAFGESQAILGFSNVPSYRRINMFFIRTGITL
ncbi:MAG: hypothetical protein N2560_04405 [Ignavibacteria bacterium]|nr:hypothetical protein [Ignavibacteria bacterium]